MDDREIGGPETKERVSGQRKDGEFFAGKGDEFANGGECAIFFFWRTESLSSADGPLFPICCIAWLLWHLHYLDAKVVCNGLLKCWDDPRLEQVVGMIFQDAWRKLIDIWESLN